MAEPNGTTLEATAPAETQPANTPMSSEERASRAFAALTAGEDASSVRASLDQEQMTRQDDASSDGPPEDAGSTQETEAGSKPADKADKIAPATADKGEKPDKKDDAKSPAEANEEQLRAHAVLLRDGWLPEEIADMKPDAVLRVAEHRRKVQGDVDRFGAQRAAGQPADKQDAKEPGARAAAPQDASPDDLVSRIADYDEDLSKEVAAIVAASNARAQTAEQQRFQSQLQTTVSSLSASYPELKDQAELDRVITRADKLARTGDYGGGTDALDMAVRHATMIEFGDRRATQAQEQLLEHSKAARDGQVDTQDTTQSGIGPMTPDQKETHAYKLLREGKDSVEVRRILSKIPDA